MAKRSKLFLLLIGALFSIIACNQNEIYHSTYDIKNSVWKASEAISFNFQVQDTVQPYDVFINLRHTSQYRYRNLYLFIETTAPTGHSVRDTFECMLADKKGKWYGRGWGDMYENRIPFKRFIRFPRSGTYSIEVKQAMRKKQLKHVSDIGIEIQTAKQPDQ